MEEVELKGKVQHIVDKLRQITTLVQLAPFVLTFIYFIVFGLYFILPDSILNVLDTLFYTSPIVALLLLAQSKILCLCKWHKMACMLPVFPQVGVLCDDIVPFSSIFAIVFLSLTMLLTGIFLFKVKSTFVVRRAR